MQKPKYYLLAIFLMMTLWLTGCHLEQGKLYFDDLKLDPITVYKMAPLETTIYCFAEAEIPKGEALEKMHDAALAEVEKSPETGNWGQLICLSLAEQATISQMKETVNALQLVIAVRHQQANPARGFKRLIEQKIRMCESIQDGLEKIEEEKVKYADAALLYEKELKKQKAATEVQKRKVKKLEAKVNKLQEIELLLHPKD